MADRPVENIHLCTCDSLVTMGNQGFVRDTGTIGVESEIMRESKKNDYHQAYFSNLTCNCNCCCFKLHLF